MIQSRASANDGESVAFASKTIQSHQIHQKNAINRLDKISDSSDGSCSEV